MADHLTAVPTAGVTETPAEVSMPARRRPAHTIIALRGARATGPGRAPGVRAAPPAPHVQGGLAA